MNAIAKELEAKFREHANLGKAAPMEAYMRNQFVFLGIKMPERTQLLRDYWKQNEKPQGEELLQTAEQLWQLTEREFHYVAMGIPIRSGYLTTYAARWTRASFLYERQSAGRFGNMQKPMQPLCTGLLKKRISPR